MTRTKKAKKSPVDVALDDAFKRLGNGVQFNIMDLSNVFAHARERIKEVADERPGGEPTLQLIEMAMNSAIAKYRKN